jgi:hypothetical protein
LTLPGAQLADHKTPTDASWLSGLVDALRQLFSRERPPRGSKEITHMHKRALSTFGLTLFWFGALTAAVCGSPQLAIIDFTFGALAFGASTFISPRT